MGLPENSVKGICIVMTILRMSFLSGVLIAVIVILRAALLHRLPKWMFSTLWGAALFRLLIPLSIPTRFSVFRVTEIWKNNVLQTDAAVQRFFSTAQWVIYENATESGTSGSVPIAESESMMHLGMEAVEVFWLLGLSVCALFFLTKHFQCLREYKAALPVESEWIKGWKREHRISREIEIRQSDRISTALTYGVFRPVVLLPKGMDLADEEKLNFVLVHEFMHIRRFDILIKWLLAAAVCIHWFNPLVWVMYLLANQDMELACDEAVIRALGEGARSSYALTLIELQEKRSFFTPLVNSFSKNALEERTVSIMKGKKMTIAGMALAAAVVICTIIVFATDSSPVSADNEEFAGQEISVMEEMFAAGADPSAQNFLFIDELVSLQNGVSAVHDVKNGHLVVYRNEEGDWTLQQGEKVTIDISISDLDNRSFSIVRTFDSWDDVQKVEAEIFYEDENFSGFLTFRSAYRIEESERFTVVFADDSYNDIHLKGQTAVIGYIVDGVAREIFSGRIAGSQSITFYAPEDGEYEFYLIGASSDTIYVQSLSIK